MLRRRAADRVALLRRWHGDRAGLTAVDAAKLADVTPNRFYQMAAAWKREPGLNAPMWIGEFGISDPNLVETVGMMDRPGIAGWSYWSWKYVAKGAAPCALRPPQGWLAIAPWLSGGGRRWKPKPEAVTSGAEAFVSYLRGYRCDPDPSVMATLRG